MERITEKSWDLLYDRICETFWGSRNAKRELRELFQNECLFEVLSEVRFQEGQVYYTKDPWNADVKWEIIGVENGKVNIIGSKYYKGQSYQMALSEEIKTSGNAEYIEFEADSRTVRLAASDNKEVDPYDRFQIITVSGSLAAGVLATARNIKEATAYCEKRGFKYTDSTGKEWNLDVIDKKSMQELRQVSSAGAAL